MAELQATHLPALYSHYRFAAWSKGPPPWFRGVRGGLSVRDPFLRSLALLSSSRDCWVHGFTAFARISSNCLPPRAFFLPLPTARRSSSCLRALLHLPIGREPSRQKLLLVRPPPVLGWLGIRAFGLWPWGAWSV